MPSKKEEKKDVGGAALPPEQDVALLLEVLKGKEKEGIPRRQAAEWLLKLATNDADKRDEIAATAAAGVSAALAQCATVRAPGRVARCWDAVTWPASSRR